MRSISVRRLFIVTLLAVLCLGLFAATALAADGDVQLMRGPTPITNGSCLGANDITVSNAYLAISIAVDSVPPWGVPKGSILDGTTIKDGVWGSDRLTLVDFLPDGWDAWPSTYQTVTVPEETADRVVVQVDRDYYAMQLVTTFTVDRDSRFVAVSTTAVNPAANSETYADIYAGYTFCTTGGYMFGPYALAEDWTVPDAYGKYVLGYDTGYSIGLHFPAADVHSGGTGWKDLYQLSTFAPGDSATYDASVQFEDSASISRFVKAVADTRADAVGAVSGMVTAAAGDFPEPPLVIVEKDGETFTWVVAEGGLYSLDLPAGDYEFYAVAKDFSPTAKVPLTVTADATVTQDFSGLAAMSSVTVKVTREGTKTPLDARIKVSGGIAPVVGFLGKSVFFTELDKIGVASFKVAAGDLDLTVSSGDLFTSRSVNVPVTVVEGEDLVVPVKIKTLFRPAAARWYSGDLHHHSDILDGVTPPEYVVRSQLAAGLDFAFLSDHDSYANNKTVRDLAKSRGVPFVSGDEISPIWAHFNVYPVSLTKPVTVDPSGTASQIIDAAHAAGMLIAINHPYIAYGYFSAADGATIPGGYDDDFDLIELQGTWVGDGSGPDERTLARVYDVWTGSLTGLNKRHSITGGYDMHDVWTDWRSGDVRTYVKIPAPLAVNQKNFLAGLKAGHSYVSTGPLMRLQNGVTFGDTVGVKKAAGRVTFTLKAQAAAGLKSIQVVREGKVIRDLKIGDDTRGETVTFSMKNIAKSWYCFIVEDTQGNRAVSNPVWTKMVK